MRKTFGKRLISGLTSTVMAATLSVGNLTPFNLLNAAAASFNYEMPTERGRIANEQCAKIEFVDKYNNGMSLSVPDNTYYLLIHAVGAEPDDGNPNSVYYSGYVDPTQGINYSRDKNHYQLIEIDADGTSWTSDLFNVIESRTVWKTAGGGEKMEMVADTVSVDGKILKNNDPTKELTLDDARTGKNCTETDDIEGFALSYSGMSEHTYIGESWEMDTHVFRATYDGETVPVSVTVVDYDEETLTPLENEFPSNYYLLSTLTDKTSGKLTGWNVSQIALEGNSKVNIGVGEFTSYADDTVKVPYDAEKYELKTRIYRTLTPGGTLATPADCNNKKLAADSIPDFRFMKTDNPQNIKIKKDEVSYQVKLDFEEPVTIEDSENIYLLVKVAHETTQDTYCLKKLTFDNVSSATVYVDEWQKNDGSALEHETYNGNRYYYKILKTTGGFNVTQLSNPDQYVEIGEGESLKGFKASYTTEQKRVTNSETHKTVYSDTITFTKQSATPDYNFKDILGSSLYFGFTADRYRQKGHTETNIAANNAEFTGDLQSDLSGNYGGDFYIANFVKFDGPNSMTDDPDGGLNVGHETKHCRDGCTVHVDDYKRAKGDNKNVAIVIDDPTYMKNSVIDPMISDMQNMSAQLAAKPANAKLVVLGGNEAYLDTTNYPYDATIYIDADEYADVIAISNGLRMRISAGQTIVFNYDSTTDISLGKYQIEIYDENGAPIKERAYGDGTTEPVSFENSNDNNQNTWLDQVSRHVVWNLNSADTVSVGSTAGIVMVPNKNSESNIKDTATGWFITAGYVENSSEWHFVYNGMPGNTGTVILNKTDIKGENEVEGAQITIYDENGEIVSNWTSDGTGDKAIWLAPGSYTLKETNDGGIFTDKLTGKKYTVTDSVFKFKVEAIEGTHGCRIIPEAGQTTVKDGFVADAKDAYYVYEETEYTPTDAEREHKITDAEIEAKKQHKITLCDAEPAEGTVVTISKKTVANNDELPGAKLQLTNTNVDWTNVIAANKDLTAVKNTAGKVIGVQWTSTSKAVKIKSLPDGRGYTLTETSESTNGEVKIGNDTYLVVESELNFDINAGEVKNVRSTDLKDKADSTSEKSYYLADTAKKLITVCDAKKAAPVKIVINKYDITGDTEIDGAQLKITGSTNDGTTVNKSWTSKPNEVWNVELEDGNYVLEETGSVVVTDDGIYEVVPSSLRFTIVGGEIVDKSSLNTDISVNGFDKTADEGYYVIGENAADDSTYIYVCDAKRTDVKLSKQNTGGEEVPGAKITLTGKDEDEKSIAFKAYNFDASGVKDGEISRDGTTISWTSGNRPVEVKGLPNGTYTMHEVTPPENYQTTTDITFKVENGKVTLESVNGKVVDGNTVVMTDEKTTTVVINKYDLTGSNEVEGAVLTLTNESGKLVTVDAAGKSIVNPWTSENGKTFEVALKSGRYTLAESADGNNSEIYDAKTDKWYSVIPNAIEFEVNDGKIISKDAGQTTISNAPNKAADEEYYFVTDNEIGVCDAEIESTEIVINKYDITGSNEVAGAQLTLTGEDVDWPKIAELNKNVQTIGETGSPITGIKWKSKVGETFNVKLRDGTYTLTETSIDNDGDAEYKVIPSSVQFVITNGKVESVSSAVTDISESFQTAAKDETTESYVVAKKGSNEIFVCDAKKVDDKVDIVIDKTDITGKTEVKGARLTLTNTNADISVDWAAVVDKTSVKNSNTSIEVLPAGGITWVSDGTPVTVSGLTNGSGYVLKETSDSTAALIDGKYTVIPTELKFNIADGKVVVDKASNSAPVSAPANGDGYFNVPSNSNKITVCDAEVTDVTLTKKDITGKNEVLNAKITIKNEKGTKVDQWTSDGTEHTIKDLANGTYTLTEEADGDKKIVDGDGKEYEVITSTVTFTVKNGKVTAVKENNKDAVTEPKTNATEGYVIADKDNNAITVCDAKKVVSTDVTINKTDITGKTELAGATLTVTNDNVDWTDVTVDNVRSSSVRRSTDTKIVGVTWTSGDDAAVIKGLANGTYTLVEEGEEFEKNGVTYTTVSSKTTFVVEDGKVTSVKGDDVKPSANENATESYVIDGKENNTITVCDAVKPIVITTDVTVSKSDITGENEIKGAKLEITNEKIDWTEITAVNAALETITKDNKVIGLKWTSGTEAVTVNGLPEGVYTLKETNDKPFEYEGTIYEVIDSEITFEIDADGKVSMTSAPEPTNANVPEQSDKGYATISGKTITICDASRTDITLSKKDIRNEDEVIGATLIVKDTEGNTVDEWESDGNDHVIKNLKNGTYTLTETAVDAEKAGAEYKIVDTTVTFTVKNGKVTSVVATNNALAASADEGSPDGYVLADKDANKITVCDAEKITTTKVTFKKTDIANSEELTGAVLTVKDSEGNTITGTPWTSGKDGKTLELDLIDGTYTLTETQGDDKIVDEEGNEYEVIDSTLTFKVEGGKVTEVTNTTDKTSGDGFYDVDSDTNTITVNDAKKVVTTKVTFKKTDIAGTEELTGAVLTVKDSEGNTITGTPWTSGKDGKTLELDLIDGTYTLTETQGDDKIVDKDGNEYEVIDSTLTFKVEGGKVTEVTNTTSKDSGDGFYDVDSDTNTITVNDAKKVDDESSQPETDSSQPDLDDSKPDESSSSKPDDSTSSKPDNDSSDSSGRQSADDESSKGPHTGDDSKPVDDDDSRGKPSTGDDSQGGVTSEDDRSKSTDSNSNSANVSETSSGSSSSSKADSQSTTTTATGTGNPNTGARVLINATEFAAAVGLCFIAIRRRKKDDEDDQ